jgi:hypothetical protein
MADYLSNLVAKSLSRTNEVRPRGLSLYGPLPGSQPPAPGLEHGGESSLIEVEAERVWQGGRVYGEPLASTPAARAQRRHAAVQRGPDNLAERLPSPTQTPLPAPRPAAGQPQADAMRTPVPGVASVPALSARPVAGEHVAARTPASPGREGVGRSAIEPLIREQVIERIVMAEAGDGTDAGEGIAGPVAAGSNRQSTSPVDPRQPAAVAAAATATATAAVVWPQVKLAPPVELTSAASAPSPAGPAPAPTIHVTIGRIEVRATAPALPAHKPPMAPAVMSLDEYLKQHARGGSE